MDTIAQFIIDGELGKKDITSEMVEKIKYLFDKFKKDTLEIDDNIIEICMGKYGAIQIYKVQKTEPQNINYKERNYISILADIKTILITDYSETEPYNRQKPFYIGHSFSRMELIKDNGEYREFHTSGISNIGFAISGFNYNDYWKNFDIGFVIDNKNVDEFINEFRSIIGK